MTDESPEFDAPEMAADETSGGEVRTIRLEAEGARLDRALAEAISDVSRSRLKALIEAGAVRVNGGLVLDPNHRLPTPAEIELTLPPPVEAIPQPQAIPLDVLYEDADLIVIDKPAGLVVHPGAGNWSGTLVNALLAHCGDSLSGIGGVLRPGIVHRLDKDTSGLMVVAKSDPVHRALTVDFEARIIERLYIALVRGVPALPKQMVEGHIGRNSKNRQKMAVLNQGGKPAATEVALVERFGPQSRPIAARLTCKLLTGRTHQVRVHLAHIGHSIIGDPLYGQGSSRTSALPPGSAREAIETFPRQALHAGVLGFQHPITGTALRFESPLPRDMQALETALRGSI